MSPPASAAASEDVSVERWRNVAALLLLLVGSLSMVGDLTSLVTLKGLGAATAASPLPKVFSDVSGLETFASRFTLEFDTPAGAVATLITPELYRHLSGPYNRRNVYGAALAYAPRLPESVWQPVFCYAFAPPDGPLRRELLLPSEAGAVRVRIETKTRGRTDSWVLEPSCRR